ncbi:hypothetical protein NA56DRAFT_621888 [Hyaloscypha hepaticicola]|uniref:Pheromone receptor n=1 Tax=Hyaloscypha hepaticicola TaxID=2082293 RepID=A0A2J6QB99_9HELO|nr:hypothetical protein NA56DRAFT_621888 [Hyaloscypha hepaticicola]
MDSSDRSNSFSPNVTIPLPNGSSLYVLLSDIDHWFYYAIRVGINYGVQVGSCFVMFFVTLFLARESQRRKLVHIFNLLSLVLGIIRAILQAIYFSSHWQEFYYFFTNDKSILTKYDFNISVAGTVAPLVMTATINVSLALQAHSVCEVMTRKTYCAILALSCLILLLAFGFRLAECVTNAKAIISDTTYYSLDWITTGTLATQAISIWWFTGLFMWKLGGTIWTRWKMGWPNLKLFDSLMIMGGCTMIIPSIFAGLGFAQLDTFPEAGSLALTTVALLLPFSSLWAAKVTITQSATFNLSSFVDSRSLSAASEDGSAIGPNTFGSLSSISGPPVSYRDASTTINSILPPRPPRRVRDSTELDLEAMGVRVDRSYGVSTARAFR